MALETQKLLSTPFRSLNAQDRLRRAIVLAPALMFFYTAFVKGNVLDGYPGLYYCLQRTVAESLLSLHLLERHLRSGAAKDRGA
jgi:hypothetical protein